MKVLANDGISQTGVKALEKAGIEVITVKVAQEQLVNYINENQVDVLLVRSATTARKALIDACPSLKIIGRGGVGMDNIDVEYAREKGLKVINTPAASSSSVAELVFAHLFTGVRYLHDSNRNMPLDGDSRFKDLKKNYAAGSELRAKTIGIIGFGRIGQEVAKIAIGCGMNVVASDLYISEADIQLDFFDGQRATFKMKDGTAIINAARGGVIDEVALVEALDSGKLAFAGLDTFENEPIPALKVLMNGKISLTPHIGAATNEAQDRIGTELASQIVSIMENA